MIIISEKIAFVQIPGPIVTDMGGEKVMLSIEHGKYFNLGEVGGVIWDLLGDPITITEIVYHLTNLYDVEKKVCQEQVESFLKMLLNERLIEEKEL